MVQLPKNRPRNVLVVCHGNICRSPLAGAVLQRMLGETRVRDRGMSDKEGRIAAKKVREYADRINYDLNHHRSRQVTQRDVDWADLVLFMDGGNLERLKKLAGAEEKAVCLGAFIDQQRIPDPNYTPRGARLNAILGDCARAAAVCGRQLLNAAQ